MPVTIFKAEVILPSLTGILADAVVMDFVLSDDSATGNDPDAAIPALFNTAAPTSAHPLAYYINDSRDRSTDACKIRYYDITTHLDGSHTGPPFSETSWTLGASAGSNALPDEVAIVASFHADLSGVPEFDGSTRPRARRRGRVYIGPLNQTPMAVDSTTHDVFVSGPTMTNINAQFAQFATALNTGTNSFWGVWSKKDAAVRRVLGGWVDNSFDSQRRRMAKATARPQWGTVIP